MLVPKLLNPGPVTLTTRVRNALLRPDICHREQEGAELMGRVVYLLEQVYPQFAATYTPVLVTGSGTAAVEAMVGSLVPREGTSLVLTNGVYGERMAAMLGMQGKQHHILDTPWDQAIACTALEQQLQAHPYTAVLVVHHETTSARLNDLSALGAVCRRYQVPMLVDAVSSFGGEAIDLDAWNAHACAATANKCLHAVPGIAFVMVRKDRLIQTSAATSVYLDLMRLYAEQSRGGMAFTPAVHALYALEEALLELGDAGGVSQRIAHYVLLSGVLRSAWKALGFIPLLKDACYASYFSSFMLPPGLSYLNLHDSLKQAGFVVYAGQGKFANEIVRVSVMGDLSLDDILRLNRALEQIIVRKMRSFTGTHTREFENKTKPNILSLAP